MVVVEGTTRRRTEVPSADRGPPCGEGPPDGELEAQGEEYVFDNALGLPLGLNDSDEVSLSPSGAGPPRAEQAAEAALLPRPSDVAGRGSEPATGSGRGIGGP